MSTNREIEFQKWWGQHTHPWTEYPRNPVEFAKVTWDAAYTAAREGHSASALAAFDRARADERAAIETRLLGMAGHAFVAGKDEHAHWFRSLVNVLFKSEDK